ncbi:amidohydrolase family protein [Kineococcus sp. NPDC059986]|uniref:amidohydrolase family protein n=1 Tax=Kineococcus sp. NPDC059986 TaxID=3155538 RepID=UPI00344E745F
MSAGEYGVAGGHVLTMDPRTGDVPAGRVHVRDGRIVAVGRDVDAPGATVLDATGGIVLPGFVDTHWHMWNSLLRGLSHDAVGYFALQPLAGAYTVEDHFTAVRFAAAEALNAGVTTCHAWANAVRDPEDAQAELEALRESGIRARYGYGGPPPGAPARDLGDDLRTALAWLADRSRDQAGDQAGNRITLGLVVQDPQVLRAAVAAARGLGLPTIGTHTDLSEVADLLGPDFLYTHGAGEPAPVLRAVAAAGLAVSLCPWTDPLTGAGLSPVVELLAAGVPADRISLSVDTTSQTAVDPFAALRMTLYSARIAQRPGTGFSGVLAQDLFGDGPPTPLMTPRDVLRMAGTNGADVLGLQAQTGSLTPGKRADVVVVRTDGLGMLPVAAGVDPVNLLVQGAHPSDVDLVVVDGVLRKVDGELLGTPARELSRRAATAQRDLLARAGHATGGLPG